MVIKRWFLIILFVGLSVLFVREINQLWTSDTNISSENTRPISASVPTGPGGGRKRYMPPTYFTVVAQKNLFSAERTEHTAKPEPVKTKQIARPNTSVKTMALFGVVLRDSEKTALLLSGKETTWVKVGDNVAGMTVEQIETDRIILSDKNNNYEIRLDDQSNPSKSAATVQKADNEPTIIFTGGPAPKVKTDSKPAAKQDDIRKTAKPKSQ